MFTRPVSTSTPSAPGFPISPTASIPNSTGVPTSSNSTRSSRLRGLSYLRNYTQNHLLPNRDHGGINPINTPQSHSTRPATNLARSVSYTPTTTLSTTNPAVAAATAAAAAAAVTGCHHEPAPGSPSYNLRPTVSNPIAPTTSATNTQTASSQAPLPRNSSSSKAGTDNSALSRPSEPDPLAQVEGASSNIMTRTRSATDAGLGQSQGTTLDSSLPSVRFSTFYDPRATRPSLQFAPVSRTLPTGHEVIRVGRYSERDNQPSVPANVPSASPVGFKSKVVSRRHCEFWCEGGKWYIKDVKSSSGTFLNHIRLSPPGTESKPFPINDGDIVQLGIDFKGGEEMIFRCVKMRLEVNRGWQNKLNAFNMTTHKRLRNMTKSNDAGSSPHASQDCSICLNSIAPRQCLFVAPCSHTWHYKCIRSLLSSPQYPIFLCPNCRAAADLEADVEDVEEWEQLDSEDEQDEDVKTNPDAASIPSQDADTLDKSTTHTTQHVDAMDVTMQIEPPQPSPQESSSKPPERPSHATSEPVPIPSPGGRVATNASTSTNDRQTRTPSPTNPNNTNGHEGPITPRNDAGPWVFDGSGVRTRAPTGRASSDSRRGEMRSLDTAALEMASHLPV